jgi:hypothetical protein
MGDRFSRETRGSLIKWALAGSLRIIAVMLAQNLLNPEANPSADPSISGCSPARQNPARKARGTGAVMDTDRMGKLLPTM